MKRLVLALPVLAILLSGCARKWTITKADGSSVTAIGKPKLKEGAYHFKDASGEPTIVQATRVREIAPASMGKKEMKDYFIP